MKNLKRMTILMVVIVEVSLIDEFLFILVNLILGKSGYFGG